MKICNACHQTFDDSVYYCPDCGEALVPYNAEGQSCAAVAIPHNTRNMTHGSKAKEPMIVWILEAAVVMVCLALGSGIAFTAGAVGFGILLGLIPRLIANKKGKHLLADLSWPVVTIANTMFGIYASIPSLIIFIILAFVL